MGHPSAMNRRKFMEIGIYTISGTIAVVSCSALARFAVAPSFNKKRAKWIELPFENKFHGHGRFVRAVLEYETKDGWLTDKARTLAYIKLTKEGEAIAISADCTHLGCIVTWDAEQNIFKCPCHDGSYDADGNVLSGPPPAALRRHPAKFEDGKILLRTETVPHGGDARERV